MNRLEDLKKLGFWWFGWGTGLVLGLAVDWCWHASPAAPVIIVPSFITLVLSICTLTDLFSGY
jgi:hypothetical protein